MFPDLYEETQENDFKIKEMQDKIAKLSRELSMSKEYLGYLIEKGDTLAKARVERKDG